MRETKHVVLAAVVTPALALSGLALASTPPKLTAVATVSSAGAPTVYVDKRGTTLDFWPTQAPDHPPVLHVARKTAGSKSFRKSKLPTAPNYTGGPFVYETATGVLRVIVGTFGNLTAWQSKNDGASWKIVDTKALNTLQTQNIFLIAAQLVAAKGGPIAYAGDDGTTGPVVQLKPDLSGVKTILTFTQPAGNKVARMVSGTVVAVGAPTPTGIPFGAGSVTGLARFPVCKTSPYPVGNPVLAAGRTTAVIAVAGCGKVRTRTISAAGKVGPLKTLGTALIGNPVIGQTTGGVSMVADPKGNLTAAYAAPGGDVRIARSTDGSHWKTASGLLPVGGRMNGPGTLSGGTPSYYSTATPIGENGRAVLDIIKLTDTYRPPTPPSGRGIPSPKHAVLGSLAVTVPGRIPLKSFRKTGKVTVRMTGAIADTVSPSLSDERVRGKTTFDICQGATKAKLKPGHARTVTLGCGSGAITIGAAVQSRGIDARKGDTVTFLFNGRNGTLTVVSKVG